MPAQRRIDNDGGARSGAGLTVAEALRIGPLARGRVLAGRKGENRVITSVNVMDTPDIKDWLKGGELLLTNVLVIKDDTQAQVALVRDLFERGAAALGVKLKRWVDSLPPDMLTLADELGLPIIEMPIDIAWTEVLNPVLTEILNRQAAYLETSQRIHDDFTRVALLGHGLQSICARLEQLTHSQCAIVDVEGEVLATGHDPEGAEPAAEALVDEDWSAAVGSLTEDAEEATRPVAREWRGGLLLSNPLAAGSGVYGRVLLFRRSQDFGDLVFTALEHASTVATLELVKERAILETEKRFRNDFVFDLLNGSIENRETALRRARSLGDWDFSRPHIIAIADLDHFEQYYLRSQGRAEDHTQRIKDSFQRLVATAAKSAVPDTVCVEQSDSVTIMFPGDKEFKTLRHPEQVKKLASTIKSQVQSKLQEVTISVGIGRFYEEVMQWPVAYREARMALSYGRRIWGRDRVIHYDDLGTYRLLLSPGGIEEMKAFADEILGPLDRCEAPRRQALFETLEQYFRCNRRIRQAAAALYVHVNTVRHRIARINGLTGLDLEDSEDCLNVEMALRIRTYLAHERERRQPGAPL